jgi:hypothetical protein
MSHADPKAHDLKQAAQQARTHLEREVTAQVGKALAKGQAATAATLAAQQKDLHRLEAQVERLGQRRSGGGFPWGLLLLAGGAYALYRSNPTVREQVQGLMKRVNPGPEGNLARAGDAAKDAVSKVTQGENPRNAVQAAGGELGRAGEKSLDHAQDRAQDLKRDAGGMTDAAQDDLKRP